MLVAEHAWIVGISLLDGLELDGLGLERGDFRHARKWVPREPALEKQPGRTPELADVLPGACTVRPNINDEIVAGEVQGKTQRRRLSRCSKFAIFGDLPAFSASLLDNVVSTA